MQARRERDELAFEVGELRVLRAQFSALMTTLEEAVAQRQALARICARTGAHPLPASAPGPGLAPATSAPGLGPRLPHLHRDWAFPGIGG